MFQYHRGVSYLEPLSAVTKLRLHLKHSGIATTSHSPHRDIHHLGRLSQWQRSLRSARYPLVTPRRHLGTSEISVAKCYSHDSARGASDNGSVLWRPCSTQSDSRHSTLEQIRTARESHSPRSSNSAIDFAAVVTSCAQSLCGAPSLRWWVYSGTASRMYLG
jgi:hypothetical protein